MYAVIKAGGHQYKVEEGQVFTVDRIPGESGDVVKFDQVLMLNGKKLVYGKPLVAGAFVEASIKEQSRLPKVVIFKYKRRKNYKRTRGHKQPVTTVEIKKIVEA